ncbi:MAG: hypothetical protein WAU78_18675 [Roseiarcus sp.]
MMGGEFGEPANGEFVRAAEREGPASGRQGEKKANSGSFDGKPLFSLKTAKKNPWKKLGNPWKKLGKVWKKFGKAWNSLKKLGAKRWPVASFHDPKGAP